MVEIFFELLHQLCRILKRLLIAIAMNAYSILAHENSSQTDIQTVDACLNEMLELGMHPKNTICMSAIREDRMKFHG